MTTAFFRTVILYFILMVGLRLMGKRQIGELEPSELVLTLIISDLPLAHQAQAHHQEEIEDNGPAEGGYHTLTSFLFILSICRKAENKPEGSASAPRGVSRRRNRWL